MRTYSGAAIFLALSLAACGAKSQDVPKTEAEVAAQIEAQKDDGAPEDLSAIPCALGGQPMAKMCSFETVAGEQGLTVIVRHPDGGFRRLLVTNDGNVMAADGADSATFSMVGSDHIEVSLAGDKYQLPAEMKPPA